MQPQRVTVFKTTAALFIAAAALAPISSQTAQAQLDAPGIPRSTIKERLIPEHFPAGPTIAPKWSIPVEPLGFSPPGPIYLGARNALASLDFIGEDKLLFTFRVPGLLHRDSANAEGEEREIRAVVLRIPQGTVESEQVWTVHDRARYLWMLEDGHFLLRDQNNLMQGDASLILKPFLKFPGPLEWVEVDPTRQYLVTDSHEPVQDKTNDNGERASPSTASAQVDADGGDTGRTPAMVVRILRRDTGRVMLLGRVRTAVHLPINDEGYLEELEGDAWKRIINLSYFTGGSRVLANVESLCQLTDTFVSVREILASACGSNGDKLVALTTDGRVLWTDDTPPVAIWPVVTIAANGSRIARETLGATHSVNAYAPVDSDDIKGQWVTVYDAATGDMALETPANPPLDSGGNVAISPSGRRVAVVNAGAIQIFELPVPPTLPASAQSK